MNLKKLVDIDKSLLDYIVFLYFSDALFMLIGMKMNLGIAGGVLLLIWNIYIMYCHTKEWKRVAVFLLLSPGLVYTNLLLQIDSLNTGVYTAYGGLALIYILFWVGVAFLLEKKQYQCATSFLTALLTTLIGIGSFLVFLLKYGNETSRIATLSAEVLLKFAVIGISIFFIADKWGKFIIDLKEIKKVTS